MDERLDDLAWFIAVARERSFTRASAQLRLSASVLSRRIRALEEHIGAPLLMRTTRSVSLTAAGERLYATVAPRLTDLHTELTDLKAATKRLAGTVRITATEHATRTYLWPRLKGLLRAYPDLNIEITNEYALRDIVADGYDLGVRLGDQVAQDMIAVRITSDLTMAIVGAPAYLADRPAVRMPQDLLNHNCIALRLPTRQSLLPWELRQGKRLLQVKVSGQLIFNDVYQIVEAAVDGFGLGYVPQDMVEADVAAGRLAWVLPAWHPTYPGLHVYYPSRRKSSRVVDLVIEALKVNPL